ncbi:hypothetical protein MN116_004808 [Schistosoma mekongi]|uniref:GIT Spa2 homology (SHD) domain-containing protein n=1 Tax=Schistosoma mekongi TaxID=38744 RepID=A0AAE1ZDD4_SCHME|nr:hypothetical protein MN116_004808 [Schistosoma mekongi]
MVRYLASAGANGYWEHILYEPMLTGPNADNRTSKLLQPHKKPLPIDPMHPTKADFIREKYMFLGFFKKPRNINQDDLNQQLHASVRTGVLETSLYLLALGANPNFLHPAKGTAPIHVACQYGQIGQVELLLAYGADICIRDSTGKTVIDLALDKALALSESITPIDTMKSMSHEEKLQLAWSSMVDLLVSAYYDLTDSLAFFLTRHVPDHKAAFFGETVRNMNYNNDGIPTISNHSKLSIITNNEIINGHFLISTSLIHESNSTPSATKSMNFKLTSSGLPTVTNVRKTDDQDDWITKARGKLSNLSNMAFSDLCIDVYDEADRRLTNSFLENLDTHNNKNTKYSNDYRIFNGCNDDNSNDTNNGLHNGTTKESASAIHPAPIPPPHKTTTTLQPHQAATSMTNLTLFFLPPNTTYSSVRNQARQKLGRLSTIEFHTLILDVLTEASIRLLPLFLPLSIANTTNSTSEVSSKKSQKTQHSYTDYFNSAEQQQQLDEFIATHTRNCPLPSLPSPSKTRNINNDTHDVERLHSTNNSDISSSSSSNSSCDDLSKRLKNQCTNISQEPFVSKASSLDHKHSQLPLSASSSPVIVKNKSSLNKLGRSRDDPVYDQVAGEVDVNGKNPSNIQTVSSLDHNTLSVNIEETCLSNQQTLLENSCVDHDNTSLVSPPSTRREFDHQIQQQQEGDDDESDSIGQIPPITSRPGPLPGSRRLHLSHTGRIVQHRASVPTTTTTATTASDITGCGSNPISLSESTTSIPKSSESPKNATLHSLMNPLGAENTNDSKNHSFQSHTHYHHSEPCCIAARNEVERLRKENTELKVQLYDLQNSKDTLEQRLEDLEGRMIQLDSVVQTLKEEKSALLAAFSAGMVMVHNPLKSWNSDAHPSTNETAITTTTASVEMYSPKVESIHSSKTPLIQPFDYEKGEAEEESRVYSEEVIDEDEIGEVDAEQQYKDDDSEYDMERVGDKSTKEGNYAVGSHCLDSGILLRQGIILRGSRGESPASVTSAVGSHSHPPTSQSNVVTPSFLGHIQSNKLSSRNDCVGQRQSSSVFTSTGQMVVSSASQNPPPYVNAPHFIQQPISKSKPALVSNASITLAEALNPDIPDDYTAPNATGSPSPAPIPVSQNLVNSSSSRIMTSSPSINISSSHHHRHGKSSLLAHERPRKPTVIGNRKHLHHSEVLISVSKSSPDYDNASGSSSLIRTSNESFHQIPKAIPSKHSESGSNEIGSDRIWKAPSSERVVRCVETIIVRIRKSSRRNHHMYTHSNIGMRFKPSTLVFRLPTHLSTQLLNPDKPLVAKIANGNRHGSSAQCSRLIQLAVKDLLNLFPSHESHPIEVKNALNNLSIESENLRKHCEQITSNSTTESLTTLNTNNSRQISSDINILIRHAHHIARAAKDLLSLFQRSIDQ